MLRKFFGNRVWRWVFVLAIVGSFCSGCVVEDRDHDHWHHHDEWHDR